MPLDAVQEQSMSWTSKEIRYACQSALKALYLVSVANICMRDTPLQIRELDKQTSKVTGIALSSNMEAVATGSEDGSIKVQNVTDTTGGWQSRVAGAITCLAVPPVSGDRTDEVAVGYEPGIFSIVRKARIHWFAKHLRTSQL